MSHSRRSKPAGVGPQTRPIFECFLTDTSEHTLYIVKDSGLKVLRAANALMSLRTFGEYKEVFLEQKAFNTLKREMARTKQAHIEEGRRIRANIRRQH